MLQDSPIMLVLASASPRRLELLSHLHPVVEPADVDERVLGGEAPRAYVQRVANAKAAAIARTGRVVLAADTCVAVDHTILGKPVSPDDARRMLTMLSGRTHDVFTAVVVVDANASATSVVVHTEVTFASLSADDIAWYINTGEPMDKAGAYGIQGKGGHFVERVSGSVSNVIGLPMVEATQLLRDAGVDVASVRSTP